DLIVPLPRRAVRNRVRFFPARDLDHSFRDQRPSDTCSKKILVLVNRAGLKHWENEISGEFLAQILNDAFRSAGAQRFFLQPGELFFLTDVRAESDDLGFIVLLEPAENDRCVESAGICEEDLNAVLIVDG